MAPARRSTSNPTATKTFTQLTKPQLLSLAALLGVEIDTQLTVPIIQNALLPAVERAQRDGTTHADFEQILPPQTSPRTTPGGDEDEANGEGEEEWGGIGTPPGRRRTSTREPTRNHRDSISGRHPSNGGIRSATPSILARGLRRRPSQQGPYSCVTRFAEPGSLAVRAREQEAHDRMSRDAAHRASNGREQGENLAPASTTTHHKQC
jgi:hypothetical protein